MIPTFFFSFYCDYFYQSSGGTHYAFRGGYSYYGSRCGVFFVALDYAASGYVWSRGAALSFKLIIIIFIKIVVQIILCVVVPREVVSIVVLFVLVYTITLVVPVGTLAPPYHLKLIIIFIKVVEHIMLFVVVSAVVVLAVVSFVLISTLISALLPGTLALPYHLNQYLL